MGYFTAVPLKEKIDFGRPNAQIGRKMADGWLLFLALHMYITSRVIINVLATLLLSINTT